MMGIDDKKKCCGCGACSLVCPKKCIVMSEDDEGFLYPVTDKDNCVGCNMCIEVCPVQNPFQERCSSQKGYLLQNRIEKIRLDSTSGGAFSAIASWVINKGGMVFGAAFDSEYSVYHTSVDNNDDISIFRNSKYVQSIMGDSFCRVKSILNEDRWVCFSGTPCQIEGLKRYLGKEHEKLVLVDFVCHGVSSPLVWKRYLEFKNVKNDEIDSIRFRDKYYGYKYSTMSFYKNGKNVYHAGSQKDQMLRAFFSNICDRPICYECPFKKRYRVSDITLWDCFTVYDFDKKLDDDKGTSRVLCHTPKGNAIVESCSEEARIMEVNPDALVKGVKEMVESVMLNPQRQQFLYDAQIMNGTELFEKYYPNNLTTWLESILRKVLLDIRLYRFVKRILYRNR